MTKWDLKYRPTRFSEVLGNDGVKKLLLRRSLQGTLTDQSMMFGGPKGCGKTTLARLVARAILCRDLQDGEPCGRCVPCVEVTDGTSRTVQELDAASQGTVDRIREMVHDADYELEGGGIQVYVLDEAQRLTKQAQDALLKSVEERLFIVILCTTEPHKIQGPIRNRLEEYPVTKPEPADLVARMVEICADEGVEADEEAIRAIASMNGGTPRSSLLSLGALAGLGPITQDSVREFFRIDSYELVDKVLSLVDSDPAASFNLLDSLSARESPTWIRDTMVAAVAAGLRQAVSAKSSFPVPIHFWGSRERGWCRFAMALGSIDRPNLADVEAILLSDGSFLSDPGTGQASPPQVAPREPQVAPREPQAAPREQPAPQAPPEKSPETETSSLEPPPDDRPKELEIDGVRFSANESLTSLDSKVGPSIGKPEAEAPEDTLKVELGQVRAPIPERQFVRGFLNRFKGSE